MSDKPLKRVSAGQDLHAASYIAVVTMTGVGVDEDTITIDGVVFEIDDDAALATATNTQVDTSGGASAAQTNTALATAVNGALAARGVVAEALTAPGSVEQCIITSGRAIAVTETLTNGTVSAAAAYGGKARSPNTHRETVVVERVPLATEVTDGVMHFMFAGAATVDAAVIRARVTATGVAKTIDSPVTISGNRVTVDNTGSTDFAATDTVSVAATLSIAI